MSENQDQQFSNDGQEPQTSFKEGLQRLADQLNETPRRKSSFLFLMSWFFGNKDVLTGLLNFLLWGVPAFFVILGAYLGFNTITEPWDKWWVFGIAAFSGLGFVMFYPYWKAYFLFKKGYFTLGYLTERGLVYKDSAGNQRCWIPSRFYRFGQPFMDYIGYLHRPDEPYLVVVGKNPNNFLVMDAAPFSEKDDHVGFTILMGLYAIVVSYNLESKTFVSEPLGLWRRLIPIGIVLWTILWFYAVFLTEVQ